MSPESSAFQEMEADPSPQESLVPASLVVAPLPPSFVRSEIRLHALFLAMAAIILLMSVLMRSEGETAVFMPGAEGPLPDVCTSRRILGIDCPGCGMTRAFIAITHGQFARAWEFNHASFVIYLFVAVQIPWHAIQIWRLKTNRRPLDWSGIYLLPIGVVVLLLLNWLWTLSRLW